MVRMPFHDPDRPHARRRHRTALTVLAGAWMEFWSLLFPAECVVCQAPDSSLCQPCAKLLRKGTVRPFRAEGSAESLPEMAPEQILPVVAAGIYRRELSQALLAYKNRGHTDLRPMLAVVLAGALQHAVHELCGGPDEAVLLVPVPSSAAARRRRGYEPVSSLLRHLDRRSMLPRPAVCARALAIPPLWWRLLFAAPSSDSTDGSSWWREVRCSLVRRFSPQKGLGASARRSNVSNTMVLSRRWRQRIAAGGGGRLNCLIVDDVLTTGATLSEAERALRAGGARVLGAVVIAATPSPKWARSSPV